MSISGIRANLKAGLGNIEGLNVYSNFPAVLNLPAAIVTLRPINPVEYDLTAGGTKLVYHFVIDLMVSKGGSIEEAQDNLDLYLQPTGDTSVKYVIEHVTLTDADILRVISVTDWGAAEYSGTGCLGCRLNVDVWV